MRNANLPAPLVSTVQSSMNGDTLAQSQIKLVRAMANYQQELRSSGLIGLVIAKLADMLYGFGVPISDYLCALEQQQRDAECPPHLRAGAHGAEQRTAPLAPTPPQG